MAPRRGIFDQTAGWQETMAIVVDTMKEMSQQTDPQAMVRAYGKRIRQFLPSDRQLSLSRRDLTRPHVCITRSSTWNEDINPWKERDRLPVLQGGLLSELIWGDEPTIIDVLQIAPDDPAADYLAGQRTLMAIPIFDQGVALNMVVLLRKEAGTFSREQFPEWVWLSNLFGRATHNLVLSEEVRRAYSDVDRELKIVGEIQRSLLPAELPQIPTMELAAYYHTSRRAGGDYYDLFPLPEGRWGIFVGDVSGHGTPAAVLMAVTHTIAHTYPGPPTPPAKMLEHLNYHLATRYTTTSDSFVTAFYGVYDPATRELLYASAGHNPPRLKRCREGTLASLNGVNGLPLGIRIPGNYEECPVLLDPGDQIVFYTDGVTEAHNADGEMFGLARLDEILGDCSQGAAGLLDALLSAVEQFAAGHPADDDRTLLVARIV